MIALRSLDPAGIYACWDWIRNGLLHCIEKTGMHYRPEDVYVRLRAGTAWLYVIDSNGDEVGFLVLTQEFDPDGLVLFIWALWCEPESMRTAHQLVYVELVKLARTIKAVRIRMQSPRKGWERQEFFQQVTAVYEHEVNHD